MAFIDPLFDQGLRLDGRKYNELRKVNCHIGTYEQADGSAYIEQGNTKVLAAVYGPHEMSGKLRALHDQAIINCQFSMAVFSTSERKHRPRGDRKSIEITQQLKHVFRAAVKTELFPKSQIDIYVEVLQADGGNFSACINAATIALIDAGIPMRDYLCACTASLVKEIPIIDVNHLEESQNYPIITVAILPKSEQIVLLQMTHRCHLDYFNNVLQAAINGCKDLYQILDQRIRLYANQLITCLE